ncbi:MAG TPA: sensor histidine kinase [Clostridiaceae bacterium]|nr:sensor histidine kinase [Clostridiaceae bacterium]
MIRELAGRIVQFLNNITLRTKLMLSFSILIAIPMSLLTFIGYNQISMTVENLVLFSVRQNFDQTISFLDYKISKVIDISNIISVDKNLTSILTKDIDTYEIAEQVKDAHEINAIYLTPYQKDNDVYRLRLFVRDELIYSKERVNIFSFNDIKETQWYDSLMARNQKILWCPPQYFVDDFGRKAEVVSAMRVILDPNRYDRIIGIFSIDILESDIRNIIKNANTTEKGVAYLINSNGEIISSSDENALNNLAAYKLKIMPENADDTWEDTVLDGKRIMVVRKNIKGTDWTLVSIIPYEEILSSSNVLKEQMFFLLLAMILVAYALAYFISDLSTKRIGHLIKRMRKAQTGELEIIKAPPGKDEVGELIANFNFMIQRIRILIEEQYRTGQEIKNSELRALQAQINPHFLYNTLDLINWTAIRNNVPDISSVVQSLAKFYKLSLSKGNDIVLVSDELMHVKLYVDIQNRRFENKVNLNIDVDESLLNCRILKIILQPIVENSIIHGILEKEEKSGNINITGREENGDIVFKITDDGVGMDEKTLNSLLQDSTTRESHGYGVRNINDRIKLRYGEAYGLKYKSEPGKGTEVEIRLPKTPSSDS